MYIFIYVFNANYVFAGKYMICVKYSDGGTPLQKCTWLLLLLLLHDSDSFRYWCGPCE